MHFFYSTVHAEYKDNKREILKCIKYLSYKINAMAPGCSDCSFYMNIHIFINIWQIVNDFSVSFTQTWLCNVKACCNYYYYSNVLNFNLIQSVNWSIFVSFLSILQHRPMGFPLPMAIQCRHRVLLCCRKSHHDLLCSQIQISNQNKKQIKTTFYT